MKEKELKKLIKSVKVEDIFLFKDSISKQTAGRICEMLKKPGIMLKDFNDFSSIKKEKLKRIINNL